MATTHSWHEGELFLQQHLGHLEAVSGAHPIFRPQLTLQHQEFHTSLNVLPVCTLDDRGRPWGSFLVHNRGEARFIRSDSFNNLQAENIGFHQDHPLKQALKDGAKVGMKGLLLNDQEQTGPALRLIAGVGVMFESRRRNKFSGFIDDRSSSLADGQSSIKIEILESLGNCPKYINTRYLNPYPDHAPKILAKNLHMSPNDTLPIEAIQHISQADAIFLSTRYTAKEHPLFKSHLGINIRGGKAGFVRVAHEKDGHVVVYFPDYSGNRFMSSLGNIHTDRVAGLTIPLLKKDQPIDVLYLTGDAEVLLDDQANAVFPGVKTAVKIVLTGYVYAADALPLRPSGQPDHGMEDFEPKDENGIGWSPYNPPVRRLRSELAAAGDAVASSSSDPSSSLTATITKVELHTSDLATFTFTLDTPIRYRAGQHTILDCSSILDPRVKEYKHMSDKHGGERELNDTGIRTWTISSAPLTANNEPSNTIQVTMRKIEGGYITPVLFQAKPGSAPPLPVLGVGGDFTLDDALKKDTAASTTTADGNSDSFTMVWIASGIGITPFLAFLKHLISVQSSVDHEKAQRKITFIVATRRSEIGTMLKLITSSITSSSSPSSLGTNASTMLLELDLHILSSNLDEQDGQSEEKELLDAAKNNGIRTSVTKHQSRFSPDWLSTNVKVPEEEGDKNVAAFICGPPSFEVSAQQALQGIGLKEAQIHRESFSY